MPLSRAGSVRQNSASQSLYARRSRTVAAVRHLEVKEPLRGIEDFAGHPIERYVLEVLLGVVPAAGHVFEAALGGDGLGGLEPRAGVRNEADPGEDLIRLDHDVVAAVDPLDPRRPIPECPIDAGLPQIGRFEHVRIGREHQGQHRHLLSHPIAGRTLGNRPTAVKVGLGSTWAEPRRRANGRNRRDLAIGTSFSASYGR